MAAGVPKNVRVGGWRAAMAARSEPRPDATGGSAGRRSRRGLSWTVTAAVLTLGGILASVAAAYALAGAQANQAHRSFQHSSAKVASTLQRALQHEDDAVVDAGGLVADRHLT